jgi:hypothetical protein
LYVRLNNCGDATVIAAANLLSWLRRERNRADYDLDRPASEQTAIDAVNHATTVNNILTALATNAALLAQITQTIQTYERAALGVNTWQGP